MFWTWTIFLRVAPGKIVGVPRPWAGAGLGFASWCFGVLSPLIRLPVSSGGHGVSSLAFPGFPVQQGWMFLMTLLLFLCFPVPAHDVWVVRDRVVSGPWSLAGLHLWSGWRTAIFGGKEGGGAAKCSFRGNVLELKVRAWVMALTALTSLVLAGVLLAVFWCSEDVFIIFYLRDLARHREDGTFGVAAVVAVQVVLSTAAI